MKSGEQEKMTRGFAMMWSKFVKELQFLIVTKKYNRGK